MRIIYEPEKTPTQESSKRIHIVWTQHDDRIGQGLNVKVRATSFNVNIYNITEILWVKGCLVFQHMFL